MRSTYQQNSRRFFRQRLITILLPCVFLFGCGKPEGTQGHDPEPTSEDRAALEAQIEELQGKNRRLEKRIERLVPKDPFIVVNATFNRIYLREGSEVVLDAICSTGSNTELLTPDGSKRWFFSTPRGVFRVRNRMRRPVWVRPDWSFVEEGEPIPGPTAAERYEPGVLGEYGLYFGNGYLIHGTLFERFLGRGVTHGCVRVGDEALEEIWKRTKIGTPIYIY